MEIENAVNIAKKELANRFDFKSSKAEIKLEKNEIKLSAEDQFKITALGEIEPGWGGGSTIGGAPRNADGSRSRLTPKQVFDAVERVLVTASAAVATVPTQH